MTNLKGRDVEISFLQGSVVNTTPVEIDLKLIEHKNPNGIVDWHLVRSKSI